MAAVAYICPRKRELHSTNFHFSPTRKSDPRPFLAPQALGPFSRVAGIFLQARASCFGKVSKNTFPEIIISLENLDFLGFVLIVNVLKSTRKISV